MISLLTFSFVSASLVWSAGRRDHARDPRLTLLLMLLLAAFPIMSLWMPKLDWEPAHLTATHRSESNALKWLTGVWAVGFLVSLIRLGVALCELMRWRRTAEQIGCLEGVAIFELQGVSGPLASGVFSPSIFLPPSWRSWTKKTLHIVLKHELAHHRRRDPLWRILTEFARAIHWYHPLVHWMAKRFIQQCEYSCDSIVLGSGVPPKHYATVLCDFAATGSPSPLASPMAETNSLVSRIDRMLKPSPQRGGMPLTALALAAVTAACALSMIGPTGTDKTKIPKEEILLRLGADPFPGDH